MARLAVIYSILRNSHNKQLKQRRDERRMMRYTDKAFSMNEDEFKANYRESKELFEEIYENVKPFMLTPKRRSDISPKYKVLVALSFYATGSYQKLVGGTYRTLMSQQSVSRTIRDVTAALNHPIVLSKWIKFPQTRQERDAIKRRFYEKFNIPSVIGCIDGTHVAIIRPIKNEERFFNRKHLHSTNVLIICDADLRVLSVDASFGGASHFFFSVFSGSLVILGDNNNEAWCKTAEATMQVTQAEKEIEFKTPIKKSYKNLRTNKIDILKCKILEEELEFTKKMHEEELKINTLEREHKETLFKIELQIKRKELEKYDKE